MGAKFTISIYNIIEALEETGRFPSSRFELEEVVVNYMRPESNRKNAKLKKDHLVLEDLDDMEFLGYFKDLDCDC